MFRLSPLPRTLAAAVRDATHPKAEIRQSAVSELGQFTVGEEGETAARHLSVALVKDVDHRVRAAAALGLADLKQSAALSPLLRATEDEHPRVRQMALLALGELGIDEERVRARLLDACRDMLPGLRFQGLIALANVHPPSAAEQLGVALTDDDPEVRYIAIRLCEQLGESVELRFGEQLRRLLCDAVPAVRLAAALLLAPRGHVQSRDAIVDVLNGRQKISHPEDEQAAITCVGELGLRDAAAGVRRRVGGWLVRKPFDWQARVALCQLGDSRSIQRLLRDLESTSYSARISAMAAAARAKVSQAGPILERIVPTDDDERESRQLALDAISSSIQSSNDALRAGVRG